MMNKDLYTILGVGKNANEADIKRAYRKLAQKYHPDVNKDHPESADRFKEVNFAYEILSDRQKRQQYDQFGFTGQGGAGGFSGGAGFDASDFSGGFADIFETFFGGSSASRSRSERQGPRPGNAIETVLKLTFEEAVFGTEKMLEIIKADTCKRCQGKGNEPGSKTVSCPTCQGTGQIRSVRQTLLGNIQTMHPCSNCDGIGQIPEKKCIECHGQMRTRQKTTVTVKIPAGIESGATIRLREKGEAGLNGGRYGDLYLHIQVAPHRQFQRQGYDIHSAHTIHLLQAVLGDEIEVETVHGKVTLKIPAGTDHGQTFKIKERGVPHMKGTSKGDHLCIIHIEIPKKLSRNEKELYAQLVEEAGLKINPDGGWLGKFKR